MKVTIDKDELYQFYIIEKDNKWGIEIDIPDEFVKEYDEISERMWKIQSKLSEYYHKNRKN